MNEVEAKADRLSQMLSDMIADIEQLQHDIESYNEQLEAASGAEADEIKAVQDKYSKIKTGLTGSVQKTSVKISELKAIIPILQEAKSAVDVCADAVKSSISREEVDDVFKDLEGQENPDFKSARTLLGIEPETEEETPKTATG